MKPAVTLIRLRMGLLAICLASCGLATGCIQTTVGGQTLPSAYYLDDDVQFFPAGPENKLYNQVRAIDRYKAERAAEANAQ